MDEPLKGYRGMPSPNDDSASQVTVPAAPSFGLPPETPIMPGTTDHHIEPQVIPPSSIDIEPLAPASKTPPPLPPPHPVASNIILPKHDASTPPPATELLESSNSVAGDTHESMLPPLRTSMYDAPVRGSQDASPKDFGIMSETNRSGTPPPIYRATAQDELLQSAAGKPLSGPVIPSTRTTSGGRLDPSLLATIPTPTEMVRDAAAAGVPPQTPAEAANELAKRTAIRTLESDVANTIAQNRLSVSGIALAQQKRQREDAVGSEVSTEKRFSWWAIGGIILAVLGAGIVTVAYLTQTKVPETTEVITPQTALIPAVPETTLDVTDMNRTDMLRAFSALTAQYATHGGISLVRLVAYRDEIVNEETTRVQHDVTAEQFFTQLGGRAPSRLVRALGAASYFGVVSKGGRAMPFLVFETTSYDSAFAGMLEWEPFIISDLPFLVWTPPIAPSAPISAPVVATSTATSSPVASSTPAIPQPVAPKPVVVNVTPESLTFLDIVVKNKDARALKNADGSTKILYAFPTPAILLIAQNEEVLSAIVEQLTTARFQK